MLNLKYTNARYNFHILQRGNWNFRSHVLSLPGAKVPWVELSFPGTFAPESGNNVELSLTEWKMACNFHSTPCPKIVVATNCVVKYNTL